MRIQDLAGAVFGELELRMRNGEVAGAAVEIEPGGLRVSIVSGAFAHPVHYTWTRDFLETAKPGSEESLARHTVSALLEAGLPVGI